MLWTSLSIALKGNHYLKAFSRRTLQHLLLSSSESLAQGGEDRLGSAR